MKKLLSVLAAVGLTATAGAGVVSCGTKKDADKPADNSKTPETNHTDDGKKTDDGGETPKDDLTVDMSTYLVDTTTGEIIG